MYVFKRQYGSVATITIPSWDTLGSALSYNDASFATSNVSIVLDNGSPAFIATAPTSEISGLVDLTFSATEMRCTKLRGYYFKTGVLTMPFVVETAGHPSAQHPYDSIPLPYAGSFTGGSPSGITLGAAGSATTNLYKGSAVYVTEGAGAGQIQSIVSYAGALKEPTVEPAWTVEPDSTSTGYIFPIPSAPDVTIPTSTLTSSDYAKITASVTTALNTYDPPTNAELAGLTSAITTNYMASGVTIHPASVVSVNLQYVNDVLIQGDGTSADSWRPA